MQLQRIVDLNAITRVEGSISEVRHTYPFKDNQYKGEILLIIDDSMRKSGMKAIIGAIGNHIAHRVGWEGPGDPLVSDREADDIVIERGLCAYLLEAKKTGKSCGQNL